MNMEELFVCDSCSLLVANGECRDKVSPEPMSLLEGSWYRVYCDPKMDDFYDEECDGFAPDCSDEWHRESSPGWVCPGCGSVLGLFYDIWKIRKI